MEQKINILFSMIKKEGVLKTICLLFLRPLEYLWYRFFKRGVFSFNNQKMPYFYHLYNVTFRKERAIEIPIVMDYVRKYLHADILEIGNVLNHYFDLKHDVVDKYEKAPGVINADIVDFQSPKKYDLIVSISTLEHVGWDETPREPGKTLKALNALRNLLKPNGKMFITMPLGYNPHVDELIEKGSFPFTRTFFLKKVSKDNRWEEVTFENVRGAKCDFPYVRANAVFAGEFENIK